MTKEETLQLHHIAPYLPYGLTGICTEEYAGIETVKGFSIHGNGIVELNTSVDDCDLTLFKLILRPLSDLTKEIEGIGVPTILMRQKFKYDIVSSSAYAHVKVENYPYQLVQWLISLHFDVFNLIESGLAIDVNLLTNQPDNGKV